MKHIVLALDSSAVGGIETHVLTLAEALVSRGLRTTILRLADHGPHPMDALAAGRGLALRVLSREAGHLSRWLKDNGATLLHTHGYKAGVLGRITRPLHRLPVVSTFHNGDRGTGRLAAYTALDRPTARASRNIAVSSQIAAGLPGPVTVIDNFVALPDSDGSEGGRRIGLVGRLSHEKGPDLFAALAVMQPRLPFVMFGDGPMMGEMDRARPANLTLAGAVPCMRAHWRSIGLLVMPPRQEGLPMAALEAMSHGIPVAAFDVGGLPKLIAHRRNGYLAAAGDVQALSDAIAEHAALPEQRSSRMRQAARDTIAARYSSRASLDDVLAVYATAGRSGGS